MIPSYPTSAPQSVSPQPILPDEDMAYTILADMKRVTREYATAAMESSCPSIRQMFTQLMNNTLRVQGELYTIMQEQQMYNASSPAMRQEIDKQLMQYQQTQQKTRQFVQQRRDFIHAGMKQQETMQSGTIPPGVAPPQQHSPNVRHTGAGGHYI